jgi:hypothetical protein
VKNLGGLPQAITDKLVAAFPSGRIRHMARIHGVEYVKDILVKETNILEAEGVIQAERSCVESVIRGDGESKFHQELQDQQTAARIQIQQVSFKHLASIKADTWRSATEIHSHHVNMTDF